MRCKNCGAEFSAREDRCPYCGAVNHARAEKKYMKKLYGMKKEMGELPETSMETYKKGVSHHLKRVIILVFVMAVVAIAGAVLFLQMEKWQDASYEEEQYKRIQWQNEVFPQLDQWYAKGDYQAILDYEDRLFEEDNKYGIYDWDHYELIDRYRWYSRCLYWSEYLKAGNQLEGLDWGDALLAGMILCYETDDEYLAASQESYELNGGRYGLSPQDAQLVEEWREAGRTLLFDDMGQTKEEMDELYTSAMKDGYMDYGVIFDYGDSLAEEETK